MKKINKTTVYIGLGTLLAGILIGRLIFGGKPHENAVEQHAHKSTENQIWTCSMHPQIRQPEPGKCPICGMDLIPLKTESSEDSPLEIKMSPTAMQLANVQTAVISKQKPTKKIRMNGKVKADERNVFSQSSHIPGRVEKLLINFTGETARKGQVLAYIYSPDLVTAQEELFEAHKIRDVQPELYQAARGKLMNWKLTEKQIDQIIETGRKREQFPVLADVSGIVLNKRVNLGDYIQKGQSLFEVADLSKVWVLFDVYESDIPWMNKGDEVTFTVQSLPGEAFKGKITFIDPVINPNTRTATARVEIPNRGNKFKPEMFAVGIVNSPIKNKDEELIVPKSAVMWTGERSIVYVKHASAAGISFMMREVTLGPALGSDYIIMKGLEEGEEIAVNGTFSIDAAAQLAGKPSMMNPEGGPAPTGHNHGDVSTTGGSSHSQPLSTGKKTKENLDELFDEYLLLKETLANDDFKKSKSTSSKLLSKLSKINMAEFKGEAHTVWMKHSGKAEKALQEINKAQDIKEVRKPFQTLSDQFIQLAKTFGPFNGALYVQHCPMAFDNKGADWLSAEKKILNPYFGNEMLNCGEVKSIIR